jgi:hypothetical protein
VADGDLTQIIELDQEDEFGEMVARMNTMAQKPRAMVDEITGASGELLEASRGRQPVGQGDVGQQPNLEQQCPGAIGDGTKAQGNHRPVQDLIARIWPYEKTEQGGAAPPLTLNVSYFCFHLHLHMSPTTTQGADIETACSVEHQLIGEYLYAFTGYGSSAMKSDPGEIMICRASFPASLLSSGHNGQGEHQVGVELRPLLRRWRVF